MAATNIHRRKSSKDLEDENFVITSSNVLNDVHATMPPSKPENHSSRGHSRSSSITAFSSPAPATGPPPASAGPHRTSFFPSRGIPSANGLNVPASASPFRSTFGQIHSHQRTRSISGPFAPPTSSPLAVNFSSNVDTTSSVSSPPLYPFPSQLPASKSLPAESSSAVSLAEPSVNPAAHTRRHSRIHSRNLSIFFPRPGSLSGTTIAEDGSQELEIKGDVEAPVSSMPSAGPNVSFPRSQSLTNGHAPSTPLGVGFTFGGRPSSTSTPTPLGSSATGSSTAKTRRGHHHKHSMSHSFFSFLEPGSVNMPPSSAHAPSQELHTQPTPIPASSWTPVSAIPASSPIPHSLQQEDFDADGTPTKPAIATTVQFLLGAWLWVCGQRIGSLSCTGIGYWVVFDAFGIGVERVLPVWLSSKKTMIKNSRERERITLRRPYGNKRVVTVFMFAQVVYLMFASVYVCKETIEHILLSAGGPGHHHHPGEDDDWIGIEFPPLMTLVTICSIFSTALLYNNHARLMTVTGNRLPSFSTFIQSLSLSSRTHYHDLPPTSPLGILFSNPYTASPLLFCVAMFLIAVLLPAAQHRPADLFLATIIAVVTFKVSYQACVVVGTVLLQTAPRRGLPSGKMEAFLRAMREVERHPQVLHLPAPHIWQLTPAEMNARKEESGESLVVTVQMHVREDLGDEEVLKLTKWVWQKCINALGGEKGVSKAPFSGNGDGNLLAREGIGSECKSGVEVTVGIVRG